MCDEFMGSLLMHPDYSMADYEFSKVLGSVGMAGVAAHRTS